MKNEKTFERNATDSSHFNEKMQKLPGKHVLLQIAASIAMTTNTASYGGRRDRTTSRRRRRRERKKSAAKKKVGKISTYLQKTDEWYWIQSPITNLSTKNCLRRLLYSAASSFIGTNVFKGISTSSPISASFLPTSGLFFGIFKIRQGQRDWINQNCGVIKIF